MTTVKIRAMSLYGIKTRECRFCLTKTAEDRPCINCGSPQDYSPCSTCGFDHSYEGQLATDEHIRLDILKVTNASGITNE